MDALKRGLNGISFTEKDIKLIMEDISNNRFADTLVTYFSALGFIRKSSDKEIYRTAKYMAEAGEMIKFK